MNLLLEVFASPLLGQASADRSSISRSEGNRVLQPGAARAGPAAVTSYRRVNVSMKIVGLC